MEVLFDNLFLLTNKEYVFKQDTRVSGVTFDRGVPMSHCTVIDFSKSKDSLFEVKTDGDIVVVTGIRL